MRTLFLLFICSLPTSLLADKYYLTPDEQPNFQNDSNGRNDFERIDANVKELNRVVGELNSLKQEVKSLKERIDELESKATKTDSEKKTK